MPCRLLPLLRSPRRAARLGFTLIELLAVIAIIAILAVFLIPRIPAAFDSARVTACKKNLSEIFSGLMLYQTKYNKIPGESGVRFFASIISRGVWENNQFNAQKLTCPAVETSFLEIGQIEDPEEWYGKLDLVTGGYSAYAGRDMKEHPLKKFPGSGKEAIVADDNEGDGTEGNHSTTTCVLYASGDVGTFEIELLREKGEIDAETQVLVVGPDSPVDALRKLSLD